MTVPDDMPLVLSVATAFTAAVNAGAPVDVTRPLAQALLRVAPAWTVVKAEVAARPGLSIKTGRDEYERVLLVAAGLAAGG
ncbi:MAG: hypothetical protein L6R30_18545 [Thermoanaerobaculia bacterium]|nr:hypothetical protein [Thermoanaerobaculia bacterium]